MKGRCNCRKWMLLSCCFPWTQRSHKNRRNLERTTYPLVNYVHQAISLASLHTRGATTWKHRQGYIHFKYDHNKYQLKNAVIVLIYCVLIYTNNSFLFVELLPIYKILYLVHSWTLSSFQRDADPVRWSMLSDMP